MTKIKDRKNESYIVSAEYQVLKLLSSNPELLDIHNELIEDNFPHKQARCIFNGLTTLHKNKETITPLAILREANRIDDEIDLDLVNNVLGTEVDESSLPHALELLQKESVKYKLHQKADVLYTELSKIGSIDADMVQSILWDAQELVVNAGEKIEMKTLPHCLDDYVEDLERRKNGEYYSFHDKFLDDNLTRKAAGGQIILISAATGAGKSGYALNLINGMINMNTPTMYFSLEMDEISTFDRLLAMRTGVPISDWYKKENIEALKKKVEAERASLEGRTFRFIDSPSLTLAKIVSLIKQFKTIYKTDYVCVYIDLITQVQEFIELEKGGSLANTIENAVNKLNAIAKSENVCFVCVAQMKRAIDDIKITKVEDTDKLKPTLGGIKNSGALAERSRAVLSVFRAKPYIEKYLPDDPKLEFLQDIMEVNILKQNQGGIGHGKYLFNAPIMTALPYEESEDEINF